MTNEKYLADLINKKLVGKTISGAVLSPDGRSVGFTTTDKTVVWVDCDAEGNGSGWLNITTG